LKSYSRLDLHKALFFLFDCFWMLRIVYGKIKDCSKSRGLETFVDGLALKQNSMVSTVWTTLK
jgi:hypothetical protein